MADFLHVRVSVSPAEINRMQTLLKGRCHSLEQSVLSCKQGQRENVSVFVVVCFFLPLILCSGHEINMGKIEEGTSQLWFMIYNIVCKTPLYGLSSGLAQENKWEVKPIYLKATYLQRSPFKIGCSQNVTELKYSYNVYLLPAKCQQWVRHQETGICKNYL